MPSTLDPSPNPSPQPIPPSPPNYYGIVTEGSCTELISSRFECAKFCASDRDEREEKLRELAETERRRKLTPEELAAEDKLLEAQGLKVFRKEKRKLGFMQKYYHKGVFFMDEDSLKDANDVRNKTYDAPTGEDVYAKKDIDGLARVKQVKKFGLMGRTKWTHLSNEDTTSFDSPWMAKDNIRKQMSSRMAGVHGDLNSAGKLRRGTKRQRRS